MNEALLLPSNKLIQLENELKYEYLSYGPTSAIFVYLNCLPYISVLP